MIRTMTDFSLDEPLHLQILTSLASSLAQSPAHFPQTQNQGQHSNDQTSRDPIGLLLEGLPTSPNSLAGQGNIQDADDDEDDWVSHEFSLLAMRCRFDR